MFWDATYVLVIIGALISLIASLNVNRTFRKFSGTGNAHGYTGQEVARMILLSAGITDVRIERIKGNLTDHYAPSEKVLRLSDSVYNETSVAAIGVAAHECGHAIQHQESYGPLALRSVAVPLANIGSYLSWPVIVIGLLLGYTRLAEIGIVMFLFVVLFQLITLPVEFNASRRALKVLTQQNILYGNEATGAKKVLTAAALTYVAALISSVLQLLRLILLVQGRNRRR